MTDILEIAVPSPLRRTFDYLPPANNPTLPAPGMRVLVSFGKQQLVGIIVKIKTEGDLPIEKLKPALEYLDEAPIIAEKTLSLLLWASKYYQHPVGECLHLGLPTLLRKPNGLPSLTTLIWKKSPNFDFDNIPARASKQIDAAKLFLHKTEISDEERKQAGISRQIFNSLHEKGMIELTEEEAKPDFHPALKQDALTLNDEQQNVMNAFHVLGSGFYCALLEGVTGSGKTEIYLQMLAHTLSEGKQALILVPEIGLTPQTIKRFSDRFDCPIACFHSNMTDKQRLTNWQLTQKGVARIIIGTRSALLSSFENLGIIIIDEEHDLSYKQHEGLRYSARDLACVKAKQEDIPIILGSATPSLETLHNAETGKFQHWRMEKRAGQAELPDIHLMDIRNAPMIEGLAEPALNAIAHTVSQGEQALIFINRRGFSPSLICHDCGWVSQCDACDARLTTHYQAQHMRCHHCQAVSPIPRQCPGCLSHELVFTGSGTERLEMALRNQFPEQPVFRIDRDTTSSKSAMSDMVEQIHQQNNGILIGTQMLAKGHHFPNVTLVVILEADAALVSPDFRALERFGQLLTQVIGRSGRELKQGQAIIQTHYPDNPQLNKLVNFGYHRLAMDLLADRQQTHLPPFSYHALIRLEDQNAEKASRTLEQIKAAIGQYPCQLLGPFPANLQRRAYFYRYQLLIQTETRAALQHCVAAVIEAGNKIVTNHKQRWSIDIDPQDLG